MECRDIQKKLEAYLDGELSPEQGKIVSDHLESCPVCQAEWESLCKLNDIVAETEGLDPGTESWQRMTDRIRHGITEPRIPKTSPFMDWLNWLLSPRYAVVKVGAALAVVAFAFVISRHITMQSIAPTSEIVPEYAIPATTPTEVTDELPRIGPTPDQIEMPGEQPPPPAILEMEKPPPPSRVEEAPPESITPKTVEKKETAAEVSRILEELPGITAQETPQPHGAGVEPSRTTQAAQPILDQEPAEPIPRTTISIPQQEPEQDKPTLSRELERTDALSGEGKQLPDRLHQKARMWRGAKTTSVSPPDDPLLTMPFSPISYWETYQVSLEPSETLISQLDSLRHQYQRCEGQPCRDDVTPYYIDALFRHALKTQSGPDIAEIKRLMEEHQVILKSSWGEQRYAARWNKIQQLSQP
jgi:hypothetical protein